MLYLAFSFLPFVSSDIKIPNLLNFIYIPLDYFLKMPHNELTELEAWLYFLSSDNPLHVQSIIEKHQFFRELYKDIIEFRYHPKELISMFSESLLIADRNTVKLMIDELRAEKAAAIAELNAEKAAVVAEMNAVISEKDAAISEKDAIISANAIELAKKDALICRLQKQIADIEK